MTEYLKGGTDEVLEKERKKESRIGSRGEIEMRMLESKIDQSFYVLTHEIVEQKRCGGLWQRGNCRSILTQMVCFSF